MRHRSARSRLRRLATILFSELASKRAPLFRRHVSPLFAQFLATSGREGTEPLAGVTDGLTLFRRQLSKPVEPFTQTRLFIRCHLLPLLEPLPRLRSLIAVHVGPLPRTVQEPLLSVGW